VNSAAARRMVKRQQMRWSKRGAHLMLQVRAASSGPINHQSSIALGLAVQADAAAPQSSVAPQLI
jgi:hypothetical protein